MDDDSLMSPHQRALVLAVIEAIENDHDVHRAVATRLTPPPSINDTDTVLRILDLPTVRYQRGEPARVVLARILDVLEAAAEDEQYTPPGGGEDQY
ncbi:MULTISPECIES: hypothetical protein [Nocardia]|uniref:hypothetical protein n=1 Tax=Nocardia TaxID=1817 RepID=UPI000D69B4B5|nr:MULTISPECIES: hypothetical protein [Nocardia]